jgi:hypothetical protein
VGSEVEEEVSEDIFEERRTVEMVREYRLSRTWSVEVVGSLAEEIPKVVLYSVERKGELANMTQHFITLVWRSSFDFFESMGLPGQQW